MAHARRTDRAERLLDLVSLLLAAKEPVTWAQLQDAFPVDYGGGSEDAALRKWERDKAELVELGVPLTWVQGNDEHPDGYIVNRSEYYLQDLDLSPEEGALLSVAGAAALQQPSFPFRADLAHALNKLLFSRDAQAERVASEGSRFVMHLPAPGAEARVSVLDALCRAVVHRKNVAMKYRSFAGEVTQRTVSPYGLAYRRGAWFFVGHCHLRNDLRTFQLERVVDLSVHELRPRHPDFEVPEGFSVRAHVALEPWQYSVHAPVEVVLRLDASVSLLARSRFGASASVFSEDDGGVVVTLLATNGEAIVREVLALSPHAELLHPTTLRTRVAESAMRIASAHDEEVLS